jgi:ribosomal protein S18 acetylase RimI-like enzyme
MEHLRTKTGEMQKMLLDSLYRVTKNEVQKASLVLGKAFHDDPVWRQVIPDEAERRQKLPLIFAISLKYALRYGEVYATSEKLKGIAIILPYDKADMTFWRLLRSGALRIGMKLGRKAGNRLGEILAPINKAQEEILKSGYLYLQAIGVSPELQGQGFGRKLLRAIFENADNEEIRIYLETTEENVQLHKKFRFQVMKEIKLSTIDLSMWAMVRETS